MPTKAGSMHSRSGGASAGVEEWVGVVCSHIRAPGEFGASLMGGVESVPVDVPAGQKDAAPVVSERPEPGCDPFGFLDDRVQPLNRTVRHAAPVKRQDLVPPLVERPTETLDFGGVRCSGSFDRFVEPPPGLPLGGCQMVCVGGPQRSEVMT